MGQEWVHYEKSGTLQKTGSWNPQTGTRNLKQEQCVSPASKMRWEFTFCESRSKRRKLCMFKRLELYSTLYGKTKDNERMYISRSLKQLVLWPTRFSPWKCCDHRPLQLLKTKGPFVLDDNDVSFFCCQKWITGLAMLLFTLDDKYKIMPSLCCQWKPFF